MSLEALDSQVVSQIAEREPVDFEHPPGGRLFRGTAGSRDSFKSLQPGGFIHDQEVTLLVPTEQFIGLTAPVEEGKIGVYVNSFGIPCVKDAADATTPTQTMRIKRIARSGGGLTYTLRSDRR